MVTLSRELEELVRRKVQTGSYESASDVVEEALMLLDERDAVMALRRDKILRDLASGVFEADNHELVESGQVFAKLRIQGNAESE